MKIILDRFEGDYAVVEIPNKKIVNLPRVLVPNAKEGDVFNIVFDKNETTHRQQSIKKLMDDVWEK